MARFLLIRFSSIGDIILTTALIRCLKNQIPNAEIYFLTKENFVPLLRNNPYLNGLVGMKKNLHDVMDSVRKIQPDYVIDLHANLRSSLLKLRLGKKSYTIPKLSFRRWKMVRSKKRTDLPHINARYFAAIESFGVSYDGLGLDYFLPEINHEEGILTKKNILVDFDAWVIGATHYTKRLPEEKIIEGIRLRNRSSILLGGKSEAQVGKRIADALPHLVVNLCGQTDFDETAIIIQGARLVFTNDTGFMHIAAALKKKIVSFWGGTVPELGMRALLPEYATQAIVIENNSISCRPCSKIGKAACPLGHFSCMKELNMNLIKDC